MKNKRRRLFPPVAIAAMLVVGTTGCVPASPQSQAFTQAQPPTGTAGPTASESPVAQPSPEPSPSAKLAAQPSKTKASSKPSPALKPRPSAKPSEMPQPPKTWPKNARKSNVKEESAAKGFVAKTEEMTSPNFGKKVQSPEDTTAPPPDYSGVAKGVALGELEAQYAEYANNNWKQTGEVVVVGEPKVEDLVVDGVTTHRVFVCLDSSGLQVSESDGFVVTPKVAPGTRTALNIYDLQEQDGQLVVVNHLFPEDPNC